MPGIGEMVHKVGNKAYLHQAASQQTIPSWPVPFSGNGALLAKAGSCYEYTIGLGRAGTAECTSCLIACASSPVAARKKEATEKNIQSRGSPTNRSIVIVPKQVKASKAKQARKRHCIAGGKQVWLVGGGPARSGGFAIGAGGMMALT